MRPRIHVPFDNWGMPVDVSVSQLVRVGDLAWSCGQCPLDEKGQVRKPGDLPAQTHIVCDYIEAMLPRADLTNASIAQLVAYYVGTKPGDADRMTAVFRERFGETPIVVPVAVPHFYYPGLMIEVDVYASAVATRLPFLERVAPNRQIEVVDGGELAWATIQWPASVSNDDDLAYLIERDGDWGYHLLKNDWIFPAGHASNMKLPLRPNSFPQLAGRLMIADCHAIQFTGLLTFSRDPVGLDVVRSTFGNNVSIFGCRTGSIVAFGGSCPDAEQGLIQQTTSIMSGLEQALEQQNLSFANVVKLNAHYVGSPSPEDLHENLKIRHSYYADPGPASTGLPVAGLGDPSAKIAIDVLAVA